MKRILIIEVVGWIPPIIMAAAFVTGLSAQLLMTSKTLRDNCGDLVPLDEVPPGAALAAETGVGLALTAVATAVLIFIWAWRTRFWIGPSIFALTWTVAVLVFAFHQQDWLDRHTGPHHPKCSQGG